MNINRQFNLRLTLRLCGWCNLQFFIFVRFFVEAEDMQKQFLAVTETANTAAADQPLCLTRNKFGEGCSGGLVALFLEFMLHPEVRSSFPPPPPIASFSFLILTVVP
ncbi:unnamed protein product [Dibothriocephalus latus]|uniref:Uncharacterized protein n=1 Tax=Dibothriocephalus latus TaxID=60516 RepID=A0A3P7NJ08_DIBLA|nr:unnamed protein product [Dibothriocephalus latus]